MKITSVREQVRVSGRRLQVDYSPEVRRCYRDYPVVEKGTRQLGKVLMYSVSLVYDPRMTYTFEFDTPGEAEAFFIAAVTAQGSA